MNQPDQSNILQPENIHNVREIKLDRVAEAVKANGTEWFPEDDDEWYEPDYSRNDRRSS